MDDAGLPPCTYSLDDAALRSMRMCILTYKALVDEVIARRAAPRLRKEAAQKKREEAAEKKIQDAKVRSVLVVVLRVCMCM